MPHAFTVQVCDFNLARALKTDTVEPSATLNSPAWSAPERLQGKRYGKSADVFSFGVILWELITLGKLLTHHAEQNRKEKTLSGVQCTHLAFPSYVSKPRDVLMSHTWIHTPDCDLLKARLKTLPVLAFLLPSSDSYCVLVHPPCVSSMCQRMTKTVLPAAKILHCKVIHA